MAKLILILVAVFAAQASAETNRLRQASRSLIEHLDLRATGGAGLKAGDAPAGKLPGAIAPAGKPLEIPDLDQLSEASRALVQDLAKKNEALRKEILDLQNQVRTLTHSLAVEKVRADENLFQPEHAEVEAVGLGLSKTGAFTKPIRLVDVNGELNVAVLDAGRAEGLRSGMFFSIQKRNRPVAKLRALDVREHLTGAEIVEFKKGEYPARGDRAIPLVTGDN